MPPDVRQTPVLGRVVRVDCISSLLVDEVLGDAELFAVDRIDQEPRIFRYCIEEFSGYGVYIAVSTCLLGYVRQPIGIQLRVYVRGEIPDRCVGTLLRVAIAEKDACRQLRWVDACGSKQLFGRPAHHHEGIQRRVE